MNGGKMPHRAALLILMAGTVLATIYATLVPFGEKPDEPSHMARVAFLAETGREPAMADTSAFPGIVMYERIQPPLYYRLTAFMVRLFPRINWTIFPDQRFGCVENGRRFLLKGSDDPPLQVLGIRFLGVFLLVTAGVLVYLAAARVFTDTGYALSALALFMLTPQILFIGSSVSNDAPALFLGAFIIAYLILGVRINAFVYGFLAALFVTTGIGVKDNLAAYVMGIPICMLCWRPRKFIPALSGYLAGMGAVLLAVVYYCNLSIPRMIDTWSWRLSHRTVNLLNLVPKDYPVAVGALIRSYWAQFGWMDIHPPGGVLIFWYLLIIVSSVGIGMGPARTRFRSFPLYFVIASAIAGWLLSLGSYSQIQGRFMFPYAAAISIGLVYGLSGLKMGKWWWILGCALVASNIACIIHLRHVHHTDNWPRTLELDAHQCYADRIVLNTLSDGFEIGQTFHCRKAGLSAIDVVFEGTHRGNGAVELILLEESTQRVFRRSILEVSSISPGGYSRFEFEPVMKSADRRFSFRIRLVDSTEAGDLSLWYALGDLFQEGTRLEDGLIRDGDIRFVTWCGSDRSSAFPEHRGYTRG